MELVSLILLLFVNVGLRLAARNVNSMGGSLPGIGIIPVESELSREGKNLVFTSNRFTF